MLTRAFGIDQRPFRAERQIALIDDECVIAVDDFDVPGHAALRDSERERKRVGFEVALSAPIVDRHDAQLLDRATHRRGVRGIRNLRRHEHRDDAARSRKRERALEERDREIGLMKCGAVAGGAKQHVAIGDHPLRSRVNARVAHPRRIAGHDVESAARHHRREVNVVRKESELAFFDGIERRAILGDPLLQLDAALEIGIERAAEEIALRRHELDELRFVAIDRTREEIRRETAIVLAHDARERGTLAAGRAAIAFDEIALRAERVHPIAIDLAASVAEEVGRAEERMALHNVAIEIRQRAHVLDAHVFRGDDRQPETLLMPNTMATQEDIIKSDRVAQKAVKT